VKLGSALGGAFHAAQAAPVYSIRTTLTGLDVNRALSATTTMKDFPARQRQRHGQPEGQRQQRPVPLFGLEGQRRWGATPWLTHGPEGRRVHGLSPTPTCGEFTSGVE
jgi:hypothetical protein